MEENAPPVVARRHSPEASYLFQASKAQSKWSETGCLLKMHDVSLVPKRKRSKLIENYGRNWTQHKFIAPDCTSVQLNGRGGRLRVFCMRPSELHRWLRKRCSWRWMSATRRLQTEWVSCEYRVVNSCDVGTSLRFDDAYRSYMILPPHDLDRLKPIGELHHVFSMFFLAWVESCSNCVSVV